MSALLLAYAAAAMAPGSSPIYRADGSEPFWSLEIAGGRMTFSDGDSGRFTAAMPRRQGLRNGYRYVTRRFNVLVQYEVCVDEGERAYSDTVRVTMGGRTFDGCGGTLLPPETLANTDWRITTINGVPVSGDNYAMSFGEGRITGQAGCNRLSGAYSQSGDRLTAGPIMATRMACPGPRMAHERGVMNVLRGPVRISFPAGDVLVLTGSGGTIRLQRV